MFGEDAGRRVRYLRTTATRVVQKDMLHLLKAQTRFAGMLDHTIYNAIRDDVLAGGYCLVNHRGNKGYNPAANVVNLFCIGPTTHAAVEASHQLRDDGVFANVIVVTSPDLLIDGVDSTHLLKLVVEEERAHHTPIITVCASHPVYLSGIASKLAYGRCQPIQLNLGVTRFDRSGTEEEILSFHKINAESIVQSVRSIIKVR